MTANPRAEFEAWFAATYGPPPSDEWLLANLGEAARLEAFMGGAWAAWQHRAAPAPAPASRPLLPPGMDLVNTVDGWELQQGDGHVLIGTADLRAVAEALLYEAAV